MRLHICPYDAPEFVCQPEGHVTFTGPRACLPFTQNDPFGVPLVRDAALVNPDGQLTDVGDVYS
jgi:hypothetical protein